MKKALFIIFVLVNCMALVSCAIFLVLCIGSSIPNSGKNFAGPLIIPFLLYGFTYIVNIFLWKKSKQVSLCLAVVNAVLSALPTVIFLALVNDLIGITILLAPLIFSVAHLVLLILLFKTEEYNIDSGENNENL